MVKRNHCFAVGRNGTLLASATRFASLTVIDGKTVKATWSNKEPMDCPSVYTGLFYAFVRKILFSNKNSNTIVEILEWQRYL